MPKSDKPTKKLSGKGSPVLRPRVRRDYDPSPLEERPLELKVRPFEEWFGYENGKGALSLSGRIERGDFLVEVSGLPPIVLSKHIVHDETGTYAMLGLQRHQLAPRRLLCVELDAQDVDSDYPCIVYRELFSDCEEYERDGAAVRSFSVFFNPRGEADGSAASLPRSIGPPALRS